MTDFIFSLTLLSLLTLIYVYVGYPAVLRLLIKLGFKKQHLKDENYQPTVSLIISCYNEVDVVDEKIQNSLALEYDKSKLQIYIVSDGSTDGTDEAAKAYSDQGIKVIRQEGRLGKTMAINLAMQQVDTEVVVFSDANAMYQPDAIAKLVRNLADEKVGYVVGAAIYTDGDENAAADSENTYWEYELNLKEMESNLHSVVGGDGAIYAIKRKLFKELDQKDINDFVNPLEIIAQGYRGIFDREAICLEETAGDFSKEARRKQRIVNRSFRGLMKVKEVLNPLKFGFFSFEVISHKLLRWLMPVFILIFALGSIYLGFAGSVIFQVISVLGLVFILLAQVGALTSSRSSSIKIFYIPYYFLMVNYYSLMGVITALSGNIQVTWSTPRESGSGSSISVKSVIFNAIVSITCLTLIVNLASMLG